MNIKKSFKYRLKKINNKLVRFPIYIKERIKCQFLNKNEIIFAGGGGWSQNFGDALNTVLIEYLSGKKVLQADFLKPGPKEKIYIVIGSILQWVKRPSVIWGAGFIAEDSQLYNKNIDIHAVRGPLTLKRLREQNYNCQNVALGDPALLLPLIYFPTEINKKFKVGLIPHYVDADHNWIKRVAQKDNNAKVIDIMCGQNWKNFVDEILSCEIIVSSTLHGLIVAEAYGIPTVWISFSDNVMGSGFKFRDYYASIGLENPVCHKIKSTTNLNDLLAFASFKEMSIDLPKLINSCPFITADNREKLLANTFNIK